MVVVWSSDRCVLYCGDLKKREEGRQKEGGRQGTDISRTISNDRPNALMCRRDKTGKQTTRLSAAVDCFSSGLVGSFASLCVSPGRTSREVQSRPSRDLVEGLFLQVLFDFECIHSPKPSIYVWCRRSLALHQHFLSGPRAAFLRPTQNGLSSTTCHGIQYPQLLCTQLHRHGTHRTVPTRPHRLQAPRLQAS